MDVNIISDYTELFIWAIVLTCIIVAAVKFLRMPTTEQIAVIKECLLNWVVQAEAQLGSGTGRVKLSEVYGQFVKAFPILKNAVPFDIFSAWVDESLGQMREMLAQNKDLRTAIGVEKEGQS